MHTLIKPNGFGCVERSKCTDQMKGIEVKSLIGGGKMIKPVWPTIRKGMENPPEYTVLNICTCGDK